MQWPYVDLEVMIWLKCNNYYDIVYVYVRVHVCVCVWRILNFGSWSTVTNCLVNLIWSYIDRSHYIIYITVTAIFFGNQESEICFSRILQWNLRNTDMHAVQWTSWYRILPGDIIIIIIPLQNQELLLINLSLT